MSTDLMTTRLATLAGQMQSDPLGRIPVPLAPPKAWLSEVPDWWDPNGGLVQVDLESGRVAALVAPYDECILDGRAGCWTPPVSATNYEYAHVGSVLTAEGELVRTANIGGGVNHFDPTLATAASLAADHYANTASRRIVGRYTDHPPHGIMLLGSMYPGSTYMDAFEAMTSALSGDWRWIQSLKDYEMVGSQLVNNPGFRPVPKLTGARVAALAELVPTRARAAARFYNVEGAKVASAACDSNERVRSLWVVEAPAAGPALAARIAALEASVAAVVTNLVPDLEMPPDPVDIMDLDDDGDEGEDWAEEFADLQGDECRHCRGMGCEKCGWLGYHGDDGMPDRALVASLNREAHVAFLRRKREQARDGDGDGFVYDGTPRMRPYNPLTDLVGTNVPFDKVRAAANGDQRARKDIIDQVAKNRATAAKAGRGEPSLERLVESTIGKRPGKGRDAQAWDTIAADVKRATGRPAPAAQKAPVPNDDPDRIPGNADPLKGRAPATPTEMAVKRAQGEGTLANPLPRPSKQRVEAKAAEKPEAPTKDGPGVVEPPNTPLIDTLEANAERREGMGPVAKVVDKLVNDPLGSTPDRSGRNSAAEQADAAFLAARLIDSAKEVEPETTATLSEVVASVGGRMEGLDHRFKTLESLTRKIDTKAKRDGGRENAAAKIGDALRYTAIMPPESYVEGANAMLERLQAEGHQVGSIENSWPPGDDYSGVNIKMIAPNGQMWELQFHTEDSFRIKTEIHGLYEITRDDSNSDAERWAAYQEMVGRWDDVVRPDGWETFGDITMRPAPPELVRVPVSEYGLTYDPDGANVVAPVRALDERGDIEWDKLPTESLPVAQIPTLRANEVDLKQKSIDKVVSGAEPFREGYVVKLYRDPDGNLHIVDGHHRVAMYAALGKDMPVQVYDGPTEPPSALDRLTRRFGLDVPTAGPTALGGDGTVGPDPVPEDFTPVPEVRRAPDATRPTETPQQRREREGAAWLAERGVTPAPTAPVSARQKRRAGVPVWAEPEWDPATESWSVRKHGAPDPEVLARTRAELEAALVGIPGVDDPTGRAAALDRVYGESWPIDTKTVHNHRGLTGDGYTPEREAAHMAIVDDLIAQLDEAGIPQERRAVFTGGLAGSGKSFSLTPDGQAAELGVVAWDLTGPVPEGATHVVLNPDWVKTRFAELGLNPGIEGLRPMEESPLMHGESSDVTRRLEEALTGLGYNVVFDGTMRDEGKTRDFLRLLDDQGYAKPDLVGADIDPEESTASVAARYAEDAASELGGRFVPTRPADDSASRLGNLSRNRDNMNYLVTDGAFNSAIILDQRGISNVRAASFDDVDTRFPLPEPAAARIRETMGLTPAQFNEEAARRGIEVRPLGSVVARAEEATWSEYEGTPITKDDLGPGGFPPRSVEKVLAMPGVRGGSGTKEDPFQVDDVDTAAVLLAEGEHQISLDTPQEVSTLLDKLQEMVAEAKAAGRKPGNYDLCKVSVPKTNLFCAETKGYPRVMMPQLSTENPVPGSYADSLPRNQWGSVDLIPDYLDFMRSNGIEVVNMDVEAQDLKATQAELNGSKVVRNVAQRRDELRKDPNSPARRIIVTSDGYIVDGHHGWATQVAISYGDGRPVIQPVTVIDAPILDVLAMTNEWAVEKGSPPQGLEMPSETPTTAVASLPLPSVQRRAQTRGFRFGSRRACYAC